MEVGGQCVDNQSAACGLERLIRDPLVFLRDIAEQQHEVRRLESTRHRIEIGFFVDLHDEVRAKALADRPGIEVIGLGGILHSESQGFAGPATLAALRSLSVNQVFLGTTAIGRGALWCGNPWDAETKRELVSIADEVVLLADSAKFSATAMANIVPFGAIHILVTDDGISEADLEEVEAAGVRVIVANTGEAGDEPADRDVAR